MENVKLNKDSWHYRAAFVYANFNRYDRYNICSYFWIVVVGVIWVVLMSLIIGGFFSTAVVQVAQAVEPMIGPNHNIFVWILAGLIGFICTVTVLLTAAFGVLFCGWLAIKGIKKLANRAEVGDSFVAESYKSWKGKFCRKIDFE